MSSRIFNLGLNEITFVDMPVGAGVRQLASNRAVVADNNIDQAVRPECHGVGAVLLIVTVKLHDRARLVEEAVFVGITQAVQGVNDRFYQVDNSMQMVDVQIANMAFNVQSIGGSVRKISRPARFMNKMMPW